MVGAHPSMPDTFDGYGILAQAEMRGVRKNLTMQPIYVYL